MRGLFLLVLLFSAATAAPAAVIFLFYRLVKLLVFWEKETYFRSTFIYKHNSRKGLEGKYAAEAKYMKNGVNKNKSWDGGGAKFEL